MFGSITMAYDIYKLSTEVEAIGTKRLLKKSQLKDVALNSFLSGCDATITNYCNFNPDAENEENSSL